MDIYAGVSSLDASVNKEEADNVMVCSHTC